MPAVPPFCELLSTCAHRRAWARAGQRVSSRLALHEPGTTPDLAGCGGRARLTSLAAVHRRCPLNALIGAAILDWNAIYQGVHLVLELS